MLRGLNEEYSLFDLFSFAFFVALSVASFHAAALSDPRPWVVPAAIACCLLCTLPRHVLAPLAKNK